MKLIPLSNGHHAKIDDQDHDKVAAFNWYPSAGRYAHTSQGRKSKLLMHHLIIGKPPKGYDVDHINGNGFDNRRDNLRIVTHSQNLLNSKLQTNNKSGHKGVHFMPGLNKYWAYINHAGKRINLGYHSSIEDAIKIRRKTEQGLMDA